MAGLHDPNRIGPGNPPASRPSTQAQVSETQLPGGQSVRRERGEPTGGKLPPPSADFQTVAVAGQDDVVAEDVEDTLTLIESGSVVITTDAAGREVTIHVDTLPDTLDDLTDVDYTPSPSDGWRLEWVSATGKWTPTAPPPIPTGLDDLDDVTIGTPTVGDRLEWGGSLWEPQPEPTHALDDLTDVDLTGASTGDVLTKDAGGDWLPVTPSPGITDLDDLGDVDTTGKAIGDVLRWDGANWVDAALAISDMADVVVTAPVAGQLLYWDGTRWKNNTVAYGMSQVADDLTPTLGGDLDTSTFLVDGRDVGTDGAKLDGIEAGAEVNDVDSVFGRTGAVLATAGDYDTDEVDNVSTVTGNSLTEALDELFQQIGNLGSDNIDNDSATVPGLTVTAGMDAMYAQIVANVIQIATNVTNISNNAAGIAAAQPILAGHTSDIATLQADVVTAHEWIMPIWAEENAALGALNVYEWAYGNGANAGVGKGVVVYVPSGMSAEIVAMGLSLGGGTATVEAVINSTPQGSTANVTVSTGTSNINTMSSPPAVVSGDVVNFRTTNSSGTSGPCHAVMYIRVYEP